MVAMQKTVEIKPAKDNQLLEVMYIIRTCAEQLAEMGICLWNDMNSESPQILDDIKQKHVFLAYLRMVPIGTITIKPYADIKEAVLIDRLAVFPHFQKRGFAKDLIDFAEDFARNNDFKTLCVNAPIEVKPIVKLLERNGFVNKGAAPESSDELAQVVFAKPL